MATSGSVDLGSTISGGGGGSGITQLTADVVAGPGSGSQTATVVAIQSVPVSNATPTNGQVLEYNSGSSQWVPTTFSAGSGTVTTVSVASANGFAGTVANATTTPAITLSTSITGVLKGNGTAISAATVGTDYSVGTGSLATGILKSTTTTGALSIAIAADFPTLNQNTSGSAGSVSGTNVITNANLVQMAASSIKGNNTGSAANAADLTVAQVNALLGDILANGTVAMSASLNLGTNQITNVVDPTTAQMAATKNYVDTMLAALNPATSCFAATIGSNLVGTYNNGVAGIGATFIITATGAFTLDGTTPAANSRILIKDQTSGFQNGIYSLTITGSLGVSPVLTRSLDYNTASDMNSAGLIPVISGTVNALTSWQQVATITTVGTDALVFSEFTANPSLYMLKANNLSDVSAKTTSFNNISPVTTTGDLIYSSSGTTNSRLAIGSAANVLTVSGGVPSWAPPATAGTVTSVGLSVPSLLSISGSPVTSSGTLALSYSGTALPVANGGTNNASLAVTAGGVFYSDGSKFVNVGAGTAGQVLTSNAASAPTWNTPPRTYIALDTGNGHGSTNTMFRLFTNITTNAGGSDMTVSNSATLGSTITINTAGVYSINYSDQAVAMNIGIGKNASGVTDVSALAPANRLAMTLCNNAGGWTANCGWTGPLAVNDVISASLGTTQSTPSTGTFVQFFIARIS